MRSGEFLNTQSRNYQILRLSLTVLILYLLGHYFYFDTFEYPAGILNEDYSPVGVFRFLPGPLSLESLDWIHYVWLGSLFLILLPRFTKLALFLAFISGCYEFGYHYNFGRVFHGNSLILQIFFLMAILWPSHKLSASLKETQASYILKGTQILIALMYFSAGVTKLVRSGWDWAFSNNLAVILHTQPQQTEAQQFLLNLPPEILMGLAASVLVLEVTSLSPVIFTSLTPFYLVGWALMHLSVYWVLGGHTTFFSHLMLLAFFMGPLLRRKPSKN